MEHLLWEHQITIKEKEIEVIMEQYLDKTTVIAEIEGYISNYKDIVAKIDRNDSTWVNSVSMIDAKIDILQHLLSFLDTLEVKEVDLENEIHSWMEDNTCRGYCSTSIRDTA